MKKHLLSLLAFLSTTITLSAAATPPAVAAEPISVIPINGQVIGFMKSGSVYFDLVAGGWGQNWAYFALSGKSSGSEGVIKASNSGKIGDATISLDIRAEKSDESQVRVVYELSTSKSVPLTSIIAGLNFNQEKFVGGRVLVKRTDGSTGSFNLPLGKAGLGSNIQECTLVDSTGTQTLLTFDPACDIGSDGQVRIILAAKELSGPVKQMITISLPGPVSLFANERDVPQEQGFESWYPFTPSNDGRVSGEIGMQDWLEKPAGKYGRITRQDDKLFYNGKPIKLWGLNMTYAGCAPDKAMADRRAAFYSKYGVNAVRLHKFADGAGWAGIQSKDSFTQLDPAGLDRMDYFVSKLKEAGIFVKLSPNFGVKPGPGDRSRVPYLDEFGPMKGDRVSTGAGSVFFLRELQDMQIEQMVNTLKHTNPYTRLTYAEDPAVAVLELLNEESILFFNTHGVLKKIPTLRKRAAESFCEWLKKRYGSKEALLAAWGPESLNCFASEGFPPESWEDKTIVPAGNPWYFDPDELEGSQKERKARFLDTMLFLYELQNEFYSRYVKAIRDTGYEGEILASNWQAGRGFSHYYNLQSDRLIGLIDRHNYFGGAKGYKIENSTMLNTPGSGILSAGMQQIDDRPFMLSEWVHVTPNEWGAEGPALIGTYGMGLQDWDVSFIFQNDDAGQFNTQVMAKDWAGVMNPSVFGIFPAISRQVLRGDVSPASVKAVRYVHFPSLHKGNLDFRDRTEQSGDVKSFSSDKVPAEALAAARCTVEFTDAYTKTPEFDMAPYRADKGIKSSTGELFWQPGEDKLDGFFTVNTPATKAVIGFAQGQKCVLGDVTIEPESRFSAIHITAQEKDKNIATSDCLILTALARSRNTDMKVLTDSIILTKGRAPILMEPVKAKITLKRKPANVYLLNHDGVRTEKTLPLSNGTFEIDGAQDKTCYYLVTFE